VNLAESMGSRERTGTRLSPIMVNKVLIVNTHSTLNAGDAAIVQAQVRFLRRRYGRLDIALTSRTPELDRKVYAPEGLTVFPPIFPAPSVYRGFFRKVAGSSRDLARRGPRRAQARALEEADLVVASGGGYFWSGRRGLPGPMFLQNIAHIRAAARRGKPLLLFPQSFGPLPGSFHERMLRRTLEADPILKIFAREEGSAEYLHAILKSPAARDKVEVCPDMAFLLDGPAPEPFAEEGDGPPARPVLAVTLRQWSFPEARGRLGRKERQEHYLAEVQHFCERHALDTGGSILVFAQSRGPGAFEDDRPISRALVERIRKNVPGARVRYVDDKGATCLDCARSVLARADLVLATRLHSAILAFGLGIPALTIAYQPKTDGVMRLFGLERFSFGIDCLQASPLVAAAAKILAAPDAIRDQIRTRARAVREEIETKLARALEAVG
jgi:colanic acid/amylovoran biosynthesis protein